MAPPRPQSSKLSRVFSENLIFLAIAIVCAYYMNLPGMLAVSNTSEEGYFHWGNVKEPVLEKFHMLRFLDIIVRDVTVGFAPSTYQVDTISWWQVMVFLSDYGVIYMALLMESSRSLSRGSIVRFPSIIATIAQFAGGGLFLPIQFFLHLVYRPPSSAQSHEDLRIDLIDALLWLPLSVLLNTGPIFGMYFASDLTKRHWWTWFWQLFATRIAIGYYSIIFFVKVTGLSRLARKLNYQTTMRCLFIPYILSQSTVWIYTISTAPYSVFKIFVPGTVEPEFAGTFIGLMRRLLQVDQISVMVSAFLWLFFLTRDMNNLGLVMRQHLTFFPLLLGWLPMLGPGATFGIIWLWKEQYMVPNVVDKRRR